MHVSLFRLLAWGRHTCCTSHSDSPSRLPLGGFVVSLTTITLFVNRGFVTWVAPAEGTKRGLTECVCVRHPSRLRAFQNFIGVWGFRTQVVVLNSRTDTPRRSVRLGWRLC